MVVDDGGIRSPRSSLNPILESMSEGVIVLGRDGRASFVNSAAAAITGYEAEEMIGAFNHEVLLHSRSDGSYYAEEECPLCAAFMQGAAHQTPHEAFWSKSGAILPVGYTSDPVVENGERIGAIVVFHDVFGRRREVGELERRFKDMLAESREGLVLSENGKIFDANESFLGIFGYDYDEVIGMDATEFAAPDDAEWVMGQVSGRKMETYEIRGLKKDGVVFPMQVQPRNFPYIGREVRITSVLDLTEQKRQEEELRRQRDLYEGILAAQSELGEGFVVVEGQKITYVNDALAEISGYSAEEIEDMSSFLELIHGEDKTVLLERRQRRMETGEGDTRYETGLLRKDGQRLDVEVAFKVFEDEELSNFMVIVRDVSWRKLAEKELQRSEEQYRSLFQTMTQGIVYHGPEGAITAANSAAQEILGLTLDQMQGKTSMDPHWHTIRDDGTELPGEAHPSMGALRTGQKVEDETMGVFVPESGEYRWLQVNAVPQFREGDEKPCRVYAIFDDITARRFAEEDLRKQERRLRQLIEQAADALFVHDLKGGIVDVNQQASVSLGYTRDELLSMTVADIEQNLDPRGFEGLWSEVLSGGPVTIEGIHVRKDGSTFPAEVRIGLFEAGEGHLMLAAARDITERRETEAERQKNERSLVEAQRIANFGNWE
jgi:PAS domain S-box-containing protein